jgi:hypothetical protein
MLDVDLTEPALSSPELTDPCESSTLSALANRFAKVAGVCRLPAGRALRAGLLTTEITLEIATGSGAGTNDALTLPPYRGTARDNGLSFGLGPSGGDLLRATFGRGGGETDFGGSVSSFVGSFSDFGGGDIDFARGGDAISSSVEVSVSDFSYGSSCSSSLQDPLSSTSRMASTFNRASIAFSSSSPPVAFAFSYTSSI